MSPSPSQDFATLEKEALQELDLRSALVKAFKKLHEEQLEVFEDKLLDFEGTLKATLKATVKNQLETQFKTVLETHQKTISSLLVPLVRKAEDDLKTLQMSVIQTTQLSEEIQRKYRLRWSRPFLMLFLSTSLSGAFVALALFLMQTSPFTVFLMDQRNREVYQQGLSWLKWREEYESTKSEGGRRRGGFQPHHQLLKADGGYGFTFYKEKRKKLQLAPQ